MDKEEIKNKIDLARIQELIYEELGVEIKKDYIVDIDGNNIAAVSPLQFKIIEKLKELEARIEALEL